MMGPGFKPLLAAGLALLANTAPVAFGALGTPITTLARVTGLDELRLSAMAGRQLPFFSLLVPAWLVWVMAGWRGVARGWPALLVCGGSLAIVQFLPSNYPRPVMGDGAAVLSALWLRVGPGRFCRIGGQTLMRMVGPLLTIACMLAIAFTTRYSGMDATLGLAFTRTGAAYPLFAALVGWLGVALTGSDT